MDGVFELEACMREVYHMSQWDIDHGTSKGAISLRETLFTNDLCWLDSKTIGPYLSFTIKCLFGCVDIRGKLCQTTLL